MILFGSKRGFCCWLSEAAAGAAAHFLWPVVSTVRLLANGRVLLVPYQPVKPGIAPQSKSPPAFDGDVAAASVQVSQDHHILEGSGTHGVAKALKKEGFRGESIRIVGQVFNPRRFSTSCELRWRRCTVGRFLSWRSSGRCAGRWGRNPSPLQNHNNISQTQYKKAIIVHFHLSIDL